MKTNRNRFYTTCFALILGGALGQQPSPAEEVVTSWTGGNSHLYLGMTNETFGYEFTVGSQNIDVTDLGLWVPAAPSPTAGFLNYSHEVGLWDIGGNLLASVTVGSGVPPSLSPSGTWYESIVPLTLNANTTYVLGAKYQPFAPDIDWGTSGAVATPGAGVTLGDARLSYNLIFEFPSAINASVNDGYYGPNMLYTVVPEPAACTMLGLGMLALVWFRRNRR